MDRMNYLINAGWETWILILVIILFILWLFVGGGNYEYVGLAPMKIGVDSNQYINGQAYSTIDKSNYNAPKVSGIDVTPKIPTVNIPTCLSPEVKKTKKCSKPEEICRDVLETIYNKPFPSARPDFLKNPETGRNLELDCYNSDMKVALEYNGIQHYKWPNFTGMSREDFVKQLRRDQYKLEMCKQLGIYVITVPYNVPNNKIKNYITYYLPENYEQRLEDEKNPDTFNNSDDINSDDINSNEITEEITEEISEVTEEMSEDFDVTFIQ